MSDSCVGFDFTYVCCEALLVSYLYVVVGFHKKIAVWVDDIALIVLMLKALSVRMWSWGESW